MISCDALLQSLPVKIDCYTFQVIFLIALPSGSFFHAKQCNYTKTVPISQGYGSDDLRSFTAYAFKKLTQKGDLLALQETKKRKNSQSFYWLKFTIPLKYLNKICTTMMASREQATYAISSAFLVKRMFTISKTNCGDTMWNLNWVVNSSKKNWGYNSTFRSVSSDRPQENDPPAVYLSSSIFQSPAFSWGRSELTDRNLELYPQFFLELITTQLRFHMVSPQLVLLIILTMQSYKFYLMFTIIKLYILHAWVVWYTVLTCFSNSVCILLWRDTAMATLQINSKQSTLSGYISSSSLDASYTRVLTARAIVCQLVAPKQEEFTV